MDEVERHCFTIYLDDAGIVVSIGRETSEYKYLILNCDDAVTDSGVLVSSNRVVE